MAKRIVRPNPCRAGECTRLPASRGLCLAHYQQAQKLVRQDRTSWEELEAAGLALPAGTSAGRLGTAWVAHVLRAPKAAPAAPASAAPPPAPTAPWPFA